MRGFGGGRGVNGRGRGGGRFVDGTTIDEAAANGIGDKQVS